MESQALLVVLGIFGLLTIISLFLKDPKKKQTTMCYCQGCKNELCGDERTECYSEDDSLVVNFKCGKCGTTSRFYFGAPVAIYLGDKFEKDNEKN